MSELVNITEPPTRERFASAAFTEALCASLLSSQLPCALVGADDSFVAISPGLAELIPDLSGRKLCDVLEIPKAVWELLRSKKEGTAYGVYQSAAGALTPVGVHLVQPSEGEAALAIVN